MPLSTGHRLGPYEIQSAIGAGGMGEVYRARDTRLQRDVAIKVLPASVTGDSDRLARFEREAQLLAALNHPNIAAIHHLDHAGDVPAIVMELIEGETLADRIARGPIPIDEALPIAKQITEALEAAHEQGIIHRDLKPANIKLTPNGAVKVLDFGLAKLNEPHGLNAPNPRTAVSMSPTLTSPALMTGIGELLGTAAYMAPEQAKGKPADKRSDIWAFGCVLFEMLTAKRAFEGDDVSDTLVAVLRDEPDWTKLPTRTSPPIRRLLARALQKDPRRRLAHIADARLDLDEASSWREGTQPASAGSRITRWGGRLGWAFGGAAIAIAIASASFQWRGASAQRPLRFTIEPPEGWIAPFEVSGGGAANLPIAVSPDGRQIVMVARNNESTARLWVRSLDTLAARELAGTDGATAPFWSPDSRYVAFFADGKLKKIDTEGGLPVSLCSLPSLNSGAWSPEGVILVSRAGGGGGGGALLRVSQAGGVPTPATTLMNGEALHIRPAFLPDGRHFLYRVTTPSTAGGAIYIGSIDSPQRQQLFSDGIGNTAYSRGHLLFVRESTLMAQPFDASRLALTGEPFPVADQIQTNGAATPVGSFSASDNGVLVYQTSTSPEFGAQLTWFDRSGKQLGVVGNRGRYADVELSPDAKQASVSISGARERRDIWLIDLERGANTKFTFDEGGAQGSVWSPDGSRIAFNANRAGHWDLFQKPSRGGVEEPLLTDMTDKIPWSWSADGRFVAYSATTNASAASDLWVLPLFGDRKPIPVAQMAFVETHARFSPDGHWIAFVSNKSGQPQVYVVPFPLTLSAEIQVSTSGGLEPRWRDDGKEIFYMSGSTLMAATVTADASALRVGVPERLFDYRTTGSPRSNYAAAPGGRRFLFNTRGDDEPSTPITVVVNWDSR